MSGKTLGTLLKNIGNKTKKAIAIGGAVATLALLPKFGNAQEQTENYKHFINPYVQPRKTLNYYGSGDVDKNGVINYDDLDRMKFGVPDYTADVDGDGTSSTTNDQKILEEFLSGEIEYLPGHWNKLETVAERKDWFLKMLAIDKSNEKLYVPGQWECGSFSNDVYFNFNWVENVTNWDEYINFDEQYDLSDLNLYNLPVYMVINTTTPGALHAINAIFLGSDIKSKDTPTEFNSWLFIEPQLDREVKPGDISMSPNHPVQIQGYGYYFNSRLGYKYGNIDLIIWNLNEGIPSLEFKKEDLITSREQSSGINNLENPFDSSDIIGKVYPNPFNTSEQLNIEYNYPGLEAKMIMTDMLGRKISEIHYDSNSTYDENLEIPREYISNLSSGIYNITVSNNKGSETSRILIKK